MNRYMEIAAAAAKLSDQPKQMGAVVVRGGRVLGIGYNKAGSCKRTPAAWSRHAEVVALLSVAGDTRGCSLYVYRGRLGPRLAKPCQSCRVVLRTAGVRKVYYSTSGGWVKERV